MGESRKFSYNQLQEALNNICLNDGDIEVKKESIEILSRFSENKKIERELLAFISNEDEELLLRKYASAAFKRCIENKNPMIRPVFQVFLNNIKVPQKKESMRKGFLLCIEVISELINEPEKDSYYIIICLIMKCLNTDNDPQLHELGAMILHALLKNMTILVMLHAKYIAEGLQILLKKSKNALKNEAEKSYVLFYHTLMSATILVQHMPKTSLILQPFRESLEDLLNLLKCFAAHGTATHFNQVSELLKILLKHKQLSGLKWKNILKACKSICRNKKYQDFARIKTLKIFGNVLSHFKRTKIFSAILKTVIGILCQAPNCKPSQSLQKHQKSHITPKSVAADLLQFICNKFSKEEVCNTAMQILLSILKSSALNEWRFRGIFISLARIVKSCGSYLNTKYEKELSVIFKAGLQDISINVRQAAIYALQNLFTFFYDESSHWLKQIFPHFLKNFELFICDLKSGNPHHPLHVERLFATMKNFYNLPESSLMLQLPLLMHLFEAIFEHIKQKRVIILTIELLQETARYTRIAFLRYFNALITKLEPFLTNWHITKNDEIRTCIVKLLTRIMIINSTYEYNKKIQHHINIFEEVIFKMLQIQHALTVIKGADSDFLLRYSPLRCSIFRFFEEISSSFPEKIAENMPIVLGTLLGTIGSIRCISKHDLELKAFSQRRLEFQNQILNQDRSNRFVKAKYFKLNDNNELETAKYSVTYDSYTLYDEIFAALIALQSLIDNCALVVLPYTEKIFSELAELLKYSYGKLRKQILHVLNNILYSFLEEFPIKDCNYLDVSILDIVNLIQKETDITTIGSCVHSFLYYVTIKEKYFPPDFDTHIYLMYMMRDIFSTVISLPHEGDQRRAKDFLLSEMIDFIPKFSKLCPPLRLNNYIPIYLCIFEEKVNMPQNASPSAEQKRAQAFEKIIESLDVMDKDDNVKFKMILHIFIKGLDDPVNRVRETAAEGLGMLVNHCNPQPVVTYKKIVNILWKRSKRERSHAVLSCIWDSITLIIRQNIWQQPIRKLLVQLTRFLPVRNKFEHNRNMVEFFEKICLERPEDLSHVVKDIYKFLLKILESGLKADKDPLYKRTLALATKLNTSALYFEDLRHISFKPFIMEAVMRALKKRIYIKAVRR